MTFQHIGHAEFKIHLENGLRLVTDPYDASCGYPVTPVSADAVLVSHSHHDHNAVENVTGHPQILDTAGTHTLDPSTMVKAILSDHDDAGGQKRGKTLLFLLEAEGLRVAHLGDLGRPLTKEEIAFLSPVDILMIPVGGYYTIDAKTAFSVAQSLNARIILPMHYRTNYNADWPIAPADDFISLFDPSVVNDTGEVLRVTRGDLNCHPHVVVL